MSDKALLQAGLRDRLSLFIRRVFQELSPGETYLPNWHIEAMAYVLTQVAEGKHVRQIITIPPRHLKSIATSVSLVAWMLGRDATKKIICASYSSDLARKLHADTRRVMNADWYRELFPGTVISKDTADDLLTTKQGGRWATSVGGPMTGFGADLIIIDDPNKADDASSEVRLKSTHAWFQNTASTRLNDPKHGAIIVVQQRIHEDDLSGALLETGDWKHLNLPAIAMRSDIIRIGPNQVHQRQKGDVLHPERMPKEVLDEKAREMGSVAFATQYQQEPGPAGGSIVQLKWFPRYVDLPDLDELYDWIILQSWDTAHTLKPHSAYSVCTTYVYYEHRLYLLDVFRQKTDVPQLLHLIPTMTEQFKADRVVIERAGPVEGIIGQLRSQDPQRYFYIKPILDKASRLQKVSWMIELGRVVLPKDAPWLPDFERELRYFPNGTYSDQVDSLSQALTWVQLRTPRPPEGMFVSFARRTQETADMAED
jgi:predicted phage terminase large subunit-like protein